MMEHKQPKEGHKKWAYAFIPLSLSMGLGLGWVLSHSITKKEAILGKITSERSRCTLRDKIRETILAIDDELATLKNTEYKKHIEYRRLLVGARWGLRDLDACPQLQESLNSIDAKTILSAANFA